MSTKTIGKKIKKARLDAHLSQKELSKVLYVSEKAVSSYESGRTKPSLQTVEKIAKKTNKPIWYFTSEASEGSEIVTKLAVIEKQLKEIKKLLKSK